MGAAAFGKYVALRKGIDIMPSGLKLEKIAEMLSGGKLKGDPDYIVTSIAAPDKNVYGSICPLWEKKLLPKAGKDAVLLTKPGWIPDGGNGIEVEDPRRALVTLLEYFAPSKRTSKPSIHESAVIAPNAVLGQNITVGPGCVVSSGASIGDNTILTGNIWIGEDVSVGDDCIIEPGAVFYHRVSIGRRCIIHSNAVIGCDGFGFMPDSRTGLLRIPQIGTVIIEDDVEIGVCVSIDRATFGETLVGKGTKIDSHVKIGHNCRIGEYCIIVAQSGIAGSSIIGNGVILAAQSGVSNHAHVGDGVTVAGRGGVASDIEAGQTVSGFPARDHKQELRQHAAERQLPQIIKNIKDIEHRIRNLEPKF